MANLRNKELNRSAIEELERQIRALDLSIENDREDISRGKQSLATVMQRIYSSSNEDARIPMPLVNTAPIGESHKNKMNGNQQKTQQGSYLPPPAINPHYQQDQKEESKEPHFSENEPLPPSYYEATGKSPAQPVHASELYPFNPHSDYAARRSTVKDKNSDSEHTPPFTPDKSHHSNSSGNGSGSDSDSPVAGKKQKINGNGSIAYTSNQRVFPAPQQQAQKVNVQPGEQKENDVISSYDAELIAKYGTSKVQVFIQTESLATFKKFIKREMVVRESDGYICVTKYRDYAENFPEFVQINSAFKNNLGDGLTSGSSRRIEVIPQSAFESLCDHARGTSQEFKNAPQGPRLPYNMDYDSACMILTIITDADGKIRHEYEWDLNRADPNYNKPNIVDGTTPLEKEKCKGKCVIM